MARSAYILLFFLLFSTGLYAQQFKEKHALDTVKSRLEQGVVLQNVKVVGKQKFGIESPQMSAIRINPQQITLMPMFMGEPDVLKSLQKLPGVTAAGEGSVGIYVRGGNYDQNLITLDGATLYSPEHLKGFASAINPEMVGCIDFYRGAFPARYGSRLSGVVDVSLRDGNFNEYHGSLFLGMLTGNMRAEGPIWKGRTSFNISGRMSYFNVFAYPIMKKCYDKTEVLEEYSRMRYYDVTAKITHKFSENNRLSLSFYHGKDNDNSSPSKSVNTNWDFSTESPVLSTYTRENSSKNEWSNVCGALNWSWKINQQYTIGTLGSYSKYDYTQAQQGEYALSQTNVMGNDSYKRREYSRMAYMSDIREFSLEAFMQWTPSKRHDIRVGIKGTYTRLTPFLDISRMLEISKYAESKREGTPSILKQYITNGVDTIMGGKQYLRQFSIYAEDNFSLNKNINLNLGLRATTHSVTGKTHISVEPRFSMRWKFLERNAIKLSYSGMSQAIHRLSTNNLISPSYLWLPINERLPLMKSNLYAVGYNCELPLGVDVSLEGYYKTMNNVVEYKDNILYAVGSIALEDMISSGKGRSYGIEVMAEKNIGKFTGLMSYTWSKTLRKFDRHGNMINGGKEFYANNDRRHNISLTGSYKFKLSKNQSIDISASWTYLTGRRGTLPVIVADYGTYLECNPYGTEIWESTSAGFYRFCQISNPEQSSYFRKLLGMITYKNLNDYKLPDTHHLDISANYAVKHNYGESVIGVSVYNIYNHMNPSMAYIGIEKDNVVMKCICPFPIMPSLSYTHKF